MVSLRHPGNSSRTQMNNRECRLHHTSNISPVAVLRIDLLLHFTDKRALAAYLVLSRILKKVKK